MTEALSRHWRIFDAYRHRAVAGKLIEVYREWATLLRAGIPLLQVFDTCLQQRRGLVRVALMRLRDDVASGLQLAEAMRRQPAVFDEFSVSLIEVGEQSGALEEVLGRLIQYRQRSRQIRGKIGNALIYPGIVFVMAVLVSILLMRFVAR